MNPTHKSSVIPDACLLIEEWERAAAGRSEPEEPVTPLPHAGRWLVALYLLLVGWAVWWLCEY